MSKNSIRKLLTMTTAEQQDDVWYDWFCRDNSLPRKTELLMQRLRGLIEAAPKFDIDAHTVAFKNNCPMNGSLYDSIYISKIGVDYNTFMVIPASGHDHVRGAAQLFWAPHPETSGDWNQILPAKATWADLKKAFAEAVAHS